MRSSFVSLNTSINHHAKNAIPIFSLLVPIFVLNFQDLFDSVNIPHENQTSYGHYFETEVVGAAQ